MDFGVLENNIQEIMSSSHFTNDFKNFSLQAYLVFKLCNIYEKGTGKEITIESLKEKNNIFDFIHDLIPHLIPLMKKIGPNITFTLKKNIIHQLVDVYIHNKKDINKLMENYH